VVAAEAVTKQSVVVVWPRATRPRTSKSSTRKGRDKNRGLSFLALSPEKQKAQAGACAFFHSTYPE
jgi:hypothetical protein